jgi:hypothetical protein
VSGTPSPFPIALRAIGLLWLFLALAVGKLQLLGALPPSGALLLCLALTGAVLAAWRWHPAIRGWVDGLDLRALVLFHATRFVGAYFLVLESRGVLPPPFFQAGLGDVVTAVLALAVCLLPLTPARRRSGIVIWNVIGATDIMLVVFTVMRLSLTRPDSLHPFTGLPLSLLPTLLVPLIIASHVIITVRLGREPTPNV